MKQAYVVVGLGYGDEAKGATVDFMTRHFNADIVVRFNGGPQAAHNVVLPDGKEHCFSQFGSGTLAGASTYLSQYMRVNPLNLLREAKHLEQLGVSDPLSKMFIHPDCLVVTPAHSARSQANATVHNRGTCGTGTGEALKDSMIHPERAIYVRDFDDMWVLNYKLRQQGLTADYTRDYMRFAKQVTIVRDGSILGNTDVVIFEGAQGYGLDHIRGSVPYVTSSNTTADNAIELCRPFGIGPMVVGCTRSYLTRHGVGPMLTENTILSRDLKELHNPADEFRGPMRYGDLDLDLLKKAIAASDVNYISLSHLDQFDLLKDIYWINSIERFVNWTEEMTYKPVGIMATGPTWEDRTATWLI